MDDNPEQPLKAKTKLEHCQKTVGSLLEEDESLLQKQEQVQTGTTGDADHSVIQGADTQMEVAKVSINRQVGQSENKKAQKAAKLNPVKKAFENGVLPEELYRLLMSIMGFQDCLLSNRLVCPLWNGLVLERCRDQRSLKLFESFHILMEYGEMLLKYEKTHDASLILNSIGDDLLFEKPEISHGQLPNILHQDGEKKLEASKVLTTFFPRVNQLVLCTEEDSLIDMEHFLAFYAEQLTSLTMTNFGLRYDDPGSKLRPFNFPMLKSLHTFDFSPQEDHLLSLLPQLESLTLYRTEISLETLLRTGTQLAELSMHRLGSVFSAPVDEFSKCPRVKTNLRKLSFDMTDSFEEAFEFISQNLTHLECLKLYEYFWDLHFLTSHLMPLFQLNSLTLQARFSFFLLDDNQFAHILPLPSVRHLTLLLLSFDYAALSMNIFSRTIFAAFPKVETIRIAFAGHLCDVVDAATFAAFEDFAGQHSNVVQLFRSKDMSPFSNFPNAVSPLLGHRRQMYEEYTQEEELFGMPICKLTASLVTRHGEDRPDLKIALRAADRLTALSNLLQLLESNSFAFTYNMAKTMLLQMFDCALRCGPAEGALFKVTCQCVLSILASNVVIEDYSEDEPRWRSFLQMAGEDEHSDFRKLDILVEHYQKQQFADSPLLFQIVKRAVLLLEHYALHDNHHWDLLYFFETLLNLANLYKTKKLNLCEDNGGEDLLLQIRRLMDDQLGKFDNEVLVILINEFLCGDNRVYGRSSKLSRVEMARLLLGRRGDRRR